MFWDVLVPRRCLTRCACACLACTYAGTCHAAAPSIEADGTQIKIKEDTLVVEGSNGAVDILASLQQIKQVGDGVLFPPSLAEYTSACQQGPTRS
jgi:hypothetical protein